MKRKKYKKSNIILLVFVQIISTLGDGVDFLDNIHLNLG